MTRKRIKRDSSGFADFVKQIFWTILQFRLNSLIGVWGI